jgi:hypothetical protein
MLDPTPVFASLLPLVWSAPPPPPPPPGPVEASSSSDLAAAAPVPEWTFEGGGSAGPADRDPHGDNRKIRRAAKTTIAGGSIAVLGLSGVIAGGAMYGLRPSKKLNELRDENGELPADDPKVKRWTAFNKAAPIIMYTGVGVLAAGAIIAVIASRRLKKLRDQRRRSTVAFGASPTFGGFAMQAEVRF